MTKRQQHQYDDAAFFRLNPIAACVKSAVAGGMLIAFVSPVCAELPVPSAVWASMGGASRSVIGNNMTINQETDRVILNWDKFNVGADSAVEFKQPSASAIALNKIVDQNPSNILGSVTANGQIYLVNKNGFVFGRDSVVNARGLAVSTLDVSEKTLEEGITKVVNSQDQQRRAAFQGSGDFYRVDAEGKKVPIKIDIQSGAQLKSAEGGRILVLAPNVINSGNVESSGGQVIMAAATDKVYLQEAPIDADPNDGAAPPENSDVRGLLVEVQTGGNVENLGTIAAKRGNVTLMGFAVNQKGKVSATTTTNLAGTIRLLAREGGEAKEVRPGQITLQATSTSRALDNGDGLGRSAQVTLASGSKTEISPEAEFVEVETTLESGAVVRQTVEKTAIDAQEQPKSRVEIMAKKVHMQSGSEIVAPSGKVSVTATTNPIAPVLENSLKNDARILMHPGAKVDVAGLTVDKTMESNILELELRNFELQDSPLQKDGILKGKTILVDMRDGTPIADIKPFVDAVGRKIGERMIEGGKIDLLSEGDVIVDKDAVLDFSGGAINFQDGLITTSKVIANGRIYDISEADPLLKYDAIYGEVTKKYTKWGVTKVWNIDGPFSLSRFEPGYVEGHDAGSLSIRGHNVSLDGQLDGKATNGRLQRRVEDQAKGGSLTVNTGFSILNTQFPQAMVIVDTLSNSGVTPKNLGIEDQFPLGEDGMAVALSMHADALVAAGIRDASFKINGNILVAENAQLKLIEGGSLSLAGGFVDVLGDIQGAGAKVTLNGGGGITVGENAQIRLQGGWVNDFINPGNLEGKSIAIEGGSFSAETNGQLKLKAGSLVDVSGGAWLQADRNLKAGVGGKVSLVAANQVDNVASNVFMGGVLNAYGLDQGGTLTIGGNTVLIRKEELDLGADNLQTLQLSADIFNKGGFAVFDIGARKGGLTVEEGANLNLSQVNRVLNTNSANQGDAVDLAGISQVQTLAPELRAPSNLTLRSNHSAGPNITSQLKVAAGASIIADDLSSVTLESDSSLIFDGRIVNHGGQVALTIVPDTNQDDTFDPRYEANQGLWLGSAASIDVSGGSEILVDVMGRSNGEVFNGGTVTLATKRGFIVTQAGSLINVSGSEAALDLPFANGIGVDYRKTVLGSNGGAIDITAAEGAYIYGDMLANAGAAPGTTGGEFSLNINNQGIDDPDSISSEFPSGPRFVNISQQRTSVLSGAFQKAGDEQPIALNGSGFIAAEQIANGGFGSLKVTADEIYFQDSLALNLERSISLEAPKLSWKTQAGSSTVGSVAIQASTVTLGSAIASSSVVVNPGGGVLNVSGDLINLVGNTAATGFNAVNLSANGDLRLRGTNFVSSAGSGTPLKRGGQFKTYSKLSLSAQQIYPTSLSAFTLTVADAQNGEVVINGQEGNRQAVLSAMGSLIIKAPSIVQNGVLAAPIGEIVLEADKKIAFGANSLTTISAAGQIIPLGITQGGLDWFLPFTDNLKSVLEAPQKNITIRAPEVARVEGALVDLSGGGDLLAYEFVPGAGGSVDVLNTDKSFAILPGNNGYAPFDFTDVRNSGRTETTRSGLKTGDSVYISGGSALAEGEYALLPARYALLPGAFLITPESASNYVLPGSTRARVDGATIVSGKRTIANTDIEDQRWTEFVIEPGEIAKTRSEYNIDLASTFFAERAANRGEALPRSTLDAGRLVFDVKSRLELPGVKADLVSGGRGGVVDIVSDNLNVVATRTGIAGTVELLASDINALRVESLLLGATRSFDSKTRKITLDVKSKNITVAENATLSSPELLLAATDKVELQKGSHLEAAGLANAGESRIELAGDGALLRVSSGGQASIDRKNTSRLKGSLLVDKDARISATNGSVLLDSTLAASLDGKLALTGGSLALAADIISLGETAGVSDGLSLSNAQLGEFDLREMVLTSRGNVNLYGQVGSIDASGKLLPVKLGNLVIDAAGISGRQNADKTASFSAKTLTLVNRNDVNGAAGTGSGVLNIEAEQLVLDEGSFSLSGFSQVNLSVRDGVTGRGTGQLNSLADLALNTPFLTAENAAKTTIDAAGHSLTLGSVNEGLPVVNKGVAAQLKLVADNILVNTKLAYKAGNVAFQALNGNLTLGEAALIDVSGATLAAGLSKPVNLSAGKVSLVSAAGNVVTAATSQIRLKGINADMTAGLLSVQAANGQATLDGFIDARGIGKANGGRIALDLASLPAIEVSGLNDLFANAGFTGGIDLRLRTGDITVDASETLVANAIALAADTGKISIDGVLDARGINGGTVKVSAADRLSLGSGGVIAAGAQGVNGSGGKVSLSSAVGGIAISDGARIDVAATGNGAEGEVNLRADRLDTDNDGVEDINIAAISPGAISGDSRVVVEAVRIYNDSTVDVNDQSAIHTDNQVYMDGLAANNIAGSRFGSDFTIVPGVEVRSTGDLEVADAWDLSGWRYGPDAVPGVLTLRAAQDLLINQNLSDGFAFGGIDLTDFGVTMSVADYLQPGESWSFNLIAGADLSAAENQAVLAGVGDFNLSNDVKLRTGTGDIHVRAGGDINYANNNAVIYTAGRPDLSNRYGLSDILSAVYFYAEYPIDGGDISLRAGGDINGKATNQLSSEWLVRTGNWTRNETHTGERPTAWGVAFDFIDRQGLTENSPSFKHQQSLTAFGGGNITVEADGDISNVSVAIPTTGKQLGQNASTDPLAYDFLENKVEINGGGNLKLNAGGDVAGGVFYVDRGTAQLVAGGSFKAGDNQGLKPIVAVGDSQFTMTAGNDLGLQAVIDPMMLPQKRSADGADTTDVVDVTTQFFGYSADSAVSLMALAGSVTFENDRDVMNRSIQNTNTGIDSDFIGVFELYPATLKALALNGDLNFNGNINLFPAANGQIEFFAGNAIKGKAIINHTDLDVSLLPSYEFPVGPDRLAFGGAINRFVAYTPDTKVPANEIHAGTPVHLNDQKPVLISTALGDIGTLEEGRDLQFTLSKPVEVKVGKDILNTSFYVQHNRVDANTIIQAGRDIRILSTPDSISGARPIVTQGVQIAGPGQLTVLAGRNIDLGASDGITTDGNRYNTVLNDNGANITAIAGLAGGQVNVDSFADRYLANAGKYQTEQQVYLARFVEEMRTSKGDPALNLETAKIAFNNLSAVDKARIESRLLDAVQQAFFNEIKLAGSRHAAAKSKQDQDQAELELLAAIETLFPGTTLIAGSNDYTIDPVDGAKANSDTSPSAILNTANALLLEKIDNALASMGTTRANATQEQLAAARRLARPEFGSISLLFSTIQSYDGGDVNLLTPRGGMIAGLPADVGLEKGPGELGVIVKKQGKINASVRDDFDVNTGRVVTLGGGDILVISTEEDIGAGRGAKTALSAPAPLISYDSIGDLVVEFSSVLAGSGIRTSSPPGAKNGDIILLAPRGIIDAGDAGIAGNNVTVSATAIVGADNIDIGGSGVGVPVAATGSVAAGLTGVSNVAAAVGKAIDSTNNVGKEAAEKMAKATNALGILSVDILGFGD